MDKTKIRQNTYERDGNSVYRRLREAILRVELHPGEVIDETALYRALSTNRIRGAVIDVWYRYPNGGDGGPRDGVMNPWPSRYPFHKLPNVIMSPHNSAWTEEMFTRRWGFVRILCG
ncbi:MAG: hypothetical protein EBZ18_06960 [Alphaproteobacteria bacterium]|nr:hypothetical protein [Alphaproteobacteria bacterium]